MSYKFLSLMTFIFAINISADDHGSAHSHASMEMSYLKSTTGMSDTQAKDGKSKQWMIKVMSTAAPSFIGNNASVATYDGKILKKGTNGWTCSPGRPMPKDGYKDAQDTNASCADIEGFKWVEAYVGGTKPNMERDAYIWMLHGDVGEDNLVAGILNKGDSTPGQWIESGPHLMFIPKDVKSLDNWNTDFTTGEPYVMFPGTMYAHVMIPLEGYYKYQKDSEPK